MSDVEQRLADLLRARAEQVTVTFDLDDFKRAGSIDLVVLERREELLDRKAQEDPVGESGVSEARDADTPRDWPRRAWVGVAAAAIVVVGIGLLAVTVNNNRDSEQADTAAPTPSFPMISPSADEQAQATDVDLYRDGTIVQISAAGNSVSLRRCRASASATCGTGWAYVTEAAGSGQVQGGLLGEASPVNLHLQVLDDRYFVVWEPTTDAQAPVKAWLIDAISGQAGRLSWQDEPTTLNSPDQRLFRCEESYSSFNTYCGVVPGPDAADGGWRFSPTDGGLPKVVDLRDGTFRPLAMPDTAVAGLPVAQTRTDRIWIGINPDGDRLGLAYSDDGGTTWTTDVALPQRLRATSTELAASLVPNGDDLLDIAADGDRVAVTRSWGGDDSIAGGDDITVYVSDDAGTTWTTANTGDIDGHANGAHLYVLDDGRLVFMGSIDHYANDLLVSTNSDWTELDEVDVDFGEGRFRVNSAGVATITLLAIPCDGVHPCPGYTQDEVESPARLDTIDFSTDLTNWTTIQIPYP